jgi:bifunctional non-homologous end joining protein LigD
MHPLLSIAPDFDSPAVAVFDLDPGEPAGILEAAEIALVLHELLSRIGPESFVKCSGSRGVQVYVPLNRPRRLRSDQGVRAQRRRDHGRAHG